MNRNAKRAATITAVMTATAREAVASSGPGSSRATDRASRPTRTDRAPLIRKVARDQNASVCRAWAASTGDHSTVPEGHFRTTVLVIPAWLSEYLRLDAP